LAVAADLVAEVHHVVLEERCRFAGGPLEAVLARITLGALLGAAPRPAC
jgi:hypothetical protein